MCIVHFTCGVHLLVPGNINYFSDFLIVSLLNNTYKQQLEFSAKKHDFTLIPQGGVLWPEKKDKDDRWKS